MSKRPDQKSKAGSSQSGLSRDVVLAHLAAHPGDTKRDLARALGVRGADRQELKRLLKDLADEGVIERGKKKSYAPPGTLPPVSVLEIVGLDPDGEPIAHPAHWTREGAAPSVLIVAGREEVGPALGRGERVLARITRTKDGYEGRVIKRLGASAHRVLGVVRRREGMVRVEPVDRKSRNSYLVDPHEINNVPDGELVVIEPLAGRMAGSPRGRIAERLGSINEPKAVSLIAIHAHGIPTEFPHEAVAEAERAKPATMKGREDLRDLPLVTIDPDDARDYDDAVWAGPDPDSANPGGHLVVVAIADVAHYVRPGSALDREAKLRGNSVYFPDRVVPMLPEALSADACSLREAEDRPALAVRMVIDAKGVKRHHRFERIMMRSAARLTYREAQSAFDGEPGGKASAIQEHIMVPLLAAYRALAKARDARQPLDLDLPERRIVIGESGRVDSISYRDRLESMRLVEEFMIQANVCAAETLEKARSPLLYRIHEKPSHEKILSFADYLRSIGMSFAKGQIIKPSMFNRILARSKDTPYQEAMNEVVLRTQSQAVYSAENFGHFGLNLARYAHFTSPIRRYADLIVHRALVDAVKLGDGGLGNEEGLRLAETAEHVSMTERRAMAAERDSVDRYVAAFMEDRVGGLFYARIVGVTRFGLFVSLAESGAQGLVPMRALGAERFRHDERRHALVGERSRTTFGLGDRVEVRLAEATPLTGGLRFDLSDADPAVPVQRGGAPRGRSGPPAGSRSSAKKRPRK